MIKKCKCIMLAVCAAVLLTGCWDYKDLDKRTIILANGIDETAGKITYTTEAAKLVSENITAGEKAQLTGIYTTSATGKYFEGARLAYNSLIPAEIFLGAQRVLVFSRRFAEKGIRAYMNRNYYTQEFRSSALTAICKETAEEFFSGKVENDISIGYAVEDTVRYLNNNGSALYRAIQEVNSDIHFRDIGYLLPYVTKKEDTVEYLGLAAMRDSKLVGIIDKKESSGFIFILSEKASSTMPIPHPGNEKNLVSIRSALKKRKIKTSYEDNRVNIYIDLKLASQLQYPYKVEPVSKADIKKLEEAVARKIEQDVISAVERSKEEFKCDVFGFGRYFKSQNIGVYRVIKWREEYLDAKFHVNVTAKIENTNLIDPNAKEQD